MKLSKSDKTFNKNFEVRSYEIDQDGEATISSISNYFQESAGLHAKNLHFDISDLRNKGMTWVLYKMDIKIDRFPKRWQKISVTSWPSSGDGLRAYRDYELRDSDNNLLGAAISQWMILNEENRRPVRLPEEIMEMGLETDHHVMKVDKKPIPETSGDNIKPITTVGRNDLDMNNHVNNVKYIDWLTGYTDIASSKKCYRVQIQYVSEAVFGDEIFHDMTYINGDEKTMRHTLYKGDQKTTIANAVTYWK